jgi:hypothetical protein
MTSDSAGPRNIAATSTAVANRGRRPGAPLIPPAAQGLAGKMRQSSTEKLPKRKQRLFSVMAHSLEKARDRCHPLPSLHTPPTSCSRSWALCGGKQRGGKCHSLPGLPRWVGKTYAPARALTSSATGSESSGPPTLASWSGRRDGPGPGPHPNTHCGAPLPTPPLAGRPCQLRGRFLSTDTVPVPVPVPDAPVGRVCGLEPWRVRASTLPVSQQDGSKWVPPGTVSGVHCGSNLGPGAPQLVPCGSPKHGTQRSPDDISLTSNLGQKWDPLGGSHVGPTLELLSSLQPIHFECSHPVTPSPHPHPSCFIVIHVENASTMLIEMRQWGECVQWVGGCAAQQDRRSACRPSHIKMAPSAGSIVGPTWDPPSWYHVGARNMGPKGLQMT